MTNEQIYAEIGKKFLEREQLSVALQETNARIQNLYAKLVEAEKKKEEPENETARKGR